MEFEIEPIFKDNDNITNKKYSSQKLITDGVLKSKQVKRIFARITNFKELLPIPEKNEQIRVITDKQLSAVDFIVMIAGNYTITDLTIAVYRANEQAVNIIGSLINDGMKLNIVLSSFFRTAKRAEVWHDKLRDIVANSKQQTAKLAYCHNHAKVIAMKTECGKYFVLEGSGNLSGNARIEQYLFEESKEAYEFHEKWILEVLNDK